MGEQPWEYQAILVYSNVTVFLPELLHPFNHWNNTHGVQGFSYRPGSVSFGTIDADDPAPTLVAVRQSYTPSKEAIRVIKVPFTVGFQGVMLADSVQSWHIPVAAGDYALFFTIEPFGKNWRYSIIFVPSDEAVKPEIIRADDLLTPPQHLLMEARPV